MTNLKLIVLKTVSFFNKTSQSCHCEEQSDAAIFDGTNRHPGTKHGKTEQNGMRSTFGTNTFCFLSCLVSCLHTSFRDPIPSTLRLPRRALKCALLAMTNLVGFAGKRNNFRNETFEKRCGAIPRKNCARRGNDRKLAGFMKKPASFLIGMF